MTKARSNLLIKLAAFIAMLVTLGSVDSVAAIVSCGGESSLPCPPVLQIFEGEVNQGLRDYPLVAGKDTLVRVFVGVVPPPLEPKPPITIPLRIDRAELDVKNSMDERILFTVTDPVIHNPITNTTQQFSENNNVSFYLDGSKLAAGEYKFTARLYNNSATPIKEFNFGPTYLLTPTRDLRLLIGFNKENPINDCKNPTTGEDLTDKECFDLSTDRILGPYIREQILPTMSRLYPIRNGVGFIDTSKDCTGDKTSGLRYFIYPDLLNIGGELIALDLFNRSRPRGPLTCDNADKVVYIGRSLPADFITGVEGGNGDPNGRSSRMGLALDPTKTRGAGGAGTVLAHEVGHNFGLVDPSQPNFDGNGHSKNFLIQDLSAFNLTRRLSIAPRKLSMPLDPLDYVCQKPSVPPRPGILASGPTSVMTSVNDDDCVLFEALDWNFLVGKLTRLSAILVPSEQLVFYIVGTVSRDNIFRRLDSRFLPPGNPTDPPIDSPYTIVILNASGRELASNGFRVIFESHIDEVIHGQGVTQPLTSASQPLTSAVFSVAQLFPLGGTEVQLRHNRTVIARLRPSVNPPRVALLAPAGGEVFGPGNREMLIQWRGSDRDGDPLTYTLSFSSDGGETFLPIGTVFGPNTTSYVWDTSFAPIGTKQGLIRVEASDGFNIVTASSELFAIALACDVNEDGNIDRNDIDAILRARNTRAALGDPRDADGDGEITVTDARICALRCTKPMCAP